MAIEVYTNLSLETTPTSPNHLVPLWMVEDLIAQRTLLPARAVATVNEAGTYAPAPAMTLTITATGPLVVDGVTLAVGDRVLLVDQTPATHNGVYTVTTVGAGATHTILTSSDDFNASNKIQSGVVIPISQGTDNEGTFWRLTTPSPITLDVTPLTFVSIEPTIRTASYSEVIDGDGAQVTWDIEHELGSTDVIVSITNNANHAVVLTGWTIEDADTVVVSFDVAPETGDHFKVVVIG